METLCYDKLKSRCPLPPYRRQEYPEYTPDFIRLAESYGAKGIRVTEKDQIAAAFEEAKKNTKAPTIIEFIIDPEEMVYPMVKPGGTLADLIMDC